MKINITSHKNRRTKCTLLVLPIFEDERPLRKINGIVDWRLCGKLSRLIELNQFSGKLAEKLLVANLQKPVAQNLIMVGLGKKKNFGQNPLQEVFHVLQGTLVQLKITSFALAPENFFSAYIKLGKVMERVRDLLLFMTKGEFQNSPPNLSIVLYQSSLMEEVGHELASWKSQLDFIQTTQVES
jgi:hypothetical protein